MHSRCEFWRLHRINLQQTIGIGRQSNLAFPANLLLTPQNLSPFRAFGMRESVGGFHPAAKTYTSEIPHRFILSGQRLPASF